ncbi:MAG: hypothetical protein COU27_02480 [Candidatus Levybacteria bacterium CG10_big_fil_rev_8_21_14_0_10_36_7]|nr:MAG: hypothetical protein COU27_02480 [Candidatus Levybacteria bacterium CG10_big_fil_rev_8_21_14_0_10_36_7]
MNILVVGSCTIDMFLKADSDHFQTNENKVCFALGDKIPTDIKDFSIGGNGANVSVGLKRLGVTSSLFTHLGSDLLSKEVETTVQKEGVITEIIKIPTKTPSLSFVFDFNNDRIIFSHHTTYDYDFSYSKTDLPDLIYLTSIGNRWENVYKKVVEFAKENKIPLALSPGSAQLEDINDTLLWALKSSNMIFINKQEAEKILSASGHKTKNVLDILSALQALGPETVSITDGANGAYAISADKTPYKISVFKTPGQTDKTGAGDAYASGFLAAYSFEKNTQESMRWGSVNAWSAMTKTGAQNGLLKKADVEEIIKTETDFDPEQLK